MFDLIPSLAILIMAGIAISALSKYPVLQIFILIVVSYTTLFPMLDFISSPFPYKISFAYHQAVIGVMFLLPMMLFVSYGSRTVPIAGGVDDFNIRLNHYLPLILLASLALFLATSYIFGLFLVRLGYGDFLYTTGSTPTILLFHYRMAVETSFFVIIYLIAAIRAVPDGRHSKLYGFILASYIGVFGIFFLINSRMQFILLVILIFISKYKTGRINFMRLIAASGAIVVVALSLTLFREFVIERNDRLAASSAFALIRETTWLIAARLNSVTMLDAAGEGGYNIFVPNLYGFWFLIKFNLSPIIDPEFYSYIKSTEQTSASVFIMNSILFRRDVDFPKSMMVEIVLMFGAFGLPLLAYCLSRIIIWIQRSLRQADISSISFIIALYALSVICQFEKEFSGFVLSLLKWSPMVAVMIFARPRTDTPDSGKRAANV